MGVGGGGGGRERERERQRQRDRHTDTQAHRHTDRQRERERQTDRQTDRQTGRDRDRNRDIERQRETETETERQRQTDRDAFTRTVGCILCKIYRKTNGASGHGYEHSASLAQAPDTGLCQHRQQKDKQERRSNEQTGFWTTDRLSGTLVRNLHSKLKTFLPIY